MARLEQQAPDLIEAFWSDTVWLTGLVSEAALHRVQDALRREWVAPGDALMVPSAPVPFVIRPTGDGGVHCSTELLRFFRSTARTVSWLTPNSAARERRLFVAASARITASCSGDSLRRRGVWYAARLDPPLTRRGGASAMTTRPDCP